MPMFYQEKQKIFWGAFLFFPLFPLLYPQQERLSHIGPEEFVQAFVHKDPLDGTKVCFLHIQSVSCDHSLSRCDEVPKSRT